MKWTDYLSREVYSRLAGCCNKRSDLQQLVDAKWKDMQDKGKDKEGFKKEDALICILEFLDCNSQFFELTEEEYKELAYDPFAGG